MIIVGEFEYNPERNSIVGPKEYLDEQGEALLKRIAVGDDLLFNVTAHLSPDAMTAVLVRLQTDYAGWVGMRRLFDELGIAEKPRAADEPSCACCERGAFTPSPHGDCWRCGHEHLDHLPEGANDEDQTTESN